MLYIRKEVPEDYQSIFKVNAEAFEREVESRLVDSLRASQALILSLVAELDGFIIGHIAFSEVTITSETCHKTSVGLAPVAVLPAFQKMGYGSKLVVTGLAMLSDNDYDAVFLMGHPEYYPRFGFVRASRFDIFWEHDYPDEAFMVKELKTGSLNGINGILRFRPEFNER